MRWSLRYHPSNTLFIPARIARFITINALLQLVLERIYHLTSLPRKPKRPEVSLFIATFQILMPYYRTPKSQRFKRQLLLEVVCWVWKLRKLYTIYKREQFEITIPYDSLIHPTTYQYISCQHCQSSSISPLSSARCRRWRDGPS